LIAGTAAISAITASLRKPLAARGEAQAVAVELPTGE
jgi:hypothetical protein